MSEVNDIEYHEIARIMIDTAITLYRDENYISVIPIAHAGEGFIGKLLGEDSSNQYLKEWVSEQGIDPKELNAAVNFLKHGHEQSYGRALEIKQHALQHVLRAINNYLTYTKSLSHLMHQFAESHKPEDLDKIEENHA